MSSDNSISIPLGIIIGLLASCVQSLGLTIQRKSHVVNQALPDHLQRVEHRRPLWLLGFAVFISSNILGSFVQIASLPVVILAPLGAVSLLWNAFFARLLLGDVFSPWMIIGTILIAGGAVLIAIFGIVPEQTRSLEDLLELFRRPTFIVYFSILGFGLIISLVITHVVEFSLARRISNTCPSDSSSIDLSPSTVNLTTQTAVTTDLVDEIHDATLATERTPLLDRKSGSSTPTSAGTGHFYNPIVTRTRLVLAISYASFSGIISGMCLLFAKSGVELLLLTLRGKNQFWRWEAWCLILGLVAFALLQLWYIHKALILADPTIVCPSAFCFYNLSSIVNGLVYFNQFSLIPPLYLFLVALGIVILLAGVWVVSIQAGGGGVDVGTWDEEIIDLTAGDLESAAMYTEPGEVTSTSETMPGGRAGPVPMERETRSESNIPNIADSVSADLGLENVGMRLERRRIRPSVSPYGRMHRPRAETLYASPRIPSIQSSPTAADQQTYRFSSPTFHSHLFTRAVSHSYANTHSQQGTSFHAHPHGTLSPPIGAGLQIGLSPVSPGFAILPVERRRGSGYGSVVGEAAGGSENAGRLRLWKLQRRRTVSDGEVSRMSGRLPNERDVDNAGEVVGEVAAEQPELETGASTTMVLHQERTNDPVGNRRTERWRWWRRIAPTWVTKV